MPIFVISYIPDPSALQGNRIKQNREWGPHSASARQKIRIWVRIWAKKHNYSYLYILYVLSSKSQILLCNSNFFLHSMYINKTIISEQGIIFFFFSDPYYSKIVPTFEENSLSLYFRITNPKIIRFLVINKKKTLNVKERIFFCSLVQRFLTQSLPPPT